VRESIRGVGYILIEALILVVIAVLVFLQTWRASITGYLPARRASRLRMRTAMEANSFTKLWNLMKCSRKLIALSAI
jgi:Cu/Ag efflux pump CusA